MTRVQALKRARAAKAAKRNDHSDLHINLRLDKADGRFLYDLLSRSSGTCERRGSADSSWTLPSALLRQKTGSRAPGLPPSTYMRLPKKHPTPSAV